MNKIIKRIQNGEDELLEKLIVEKEEFIYSFIEMYKEMFDDYDELKQEAVCVYIYLIKRFNFNCYFSTYITTKMRQYINKFILSNLDRINSIDDRIMISQYFYNKCKNHIKSEPTREALRFYLNIKNIYVEQIINYAKNVGSYISYNHSLYGEVDENYEVVERFVDSDLFMKNILKKYLTKKQAESIIMNFGFIDRPKSLVYLGKLENTSKQTISDRVEKGKMKIKKLIEEGN